MTTPRVPCGPIHTTRVSPCSTRVWYVFVYVRCQELGAWGSKQDTGAAHHEPQQNRASCKRPPRMHHAPARRTLSRVTEGKKHLVFYWHFLRG